MLGKRNDFWKCCFDWSSGVRQARVPFQRIALGIRTRSNNLLCRHYGAVRDTIKYILQFFCGFINVIALATNFKLERFFLKLIYILLMTKVCLLFCHLTGTLFIA